MTYKRNWLIVCELLSDDPDCPKPKDCNFPKEFLLFGWICIFIALILAFLVILW